jgi:uncharacterized protein (DUF1800 family)
MSRETDQRPPPDWVFEPIPTRVERNTWTSDQRRDQQRRLGRRYELLPTWWVREMLNTRSPLTERMTLFRHDQFTPGRDKVPYPQPRRPRARLHRWNLDPDTQTYRD